ncbi:hypothetical protein JTB14_021855 [Gonioctena quinquepunctata]|nr:hypothetical protein JTB14_021855 [Gonioctena quinquepunctata]
MLFSLDCQTSVYADEFRISGEPLTESAFLVDWLIPLNIDRCSILHLGKTHPQLTYNVSDNQLKSRNSQVYLGVTVTRHLSWSQPIWNIAKKANKSHHLLKKTFTNPTPELATRLYATYVRSTVEFAAAVWSSWLVRDRKPLERIQDQRLVG